MRKDRENQIYSGPGVVVIDIRPVPGLGIIVKTMIFGEMAQM